MGRDIIAAGLLGICAVILVTLCHAPLERALTWPRRYVRARGYELELARHTARAMLEELERVPDYRTATLERAEVAGDPPWPVLEPRWQSDLERAGEELPGWAEPRADRVTAFGMESGSSGSDYGKAPGAWAVPADSGTGDTGRGGGRGAEAYAPPLSAPTITGDDLGPLTDTWVRLEQAWADGMAAPSVTLEGAPTRLGTLFDAVLAAEVSAYIQDQNRDVTEYLERLLGIRW